jgi:hypothetical protein
MGQAASTPSRPLQNFALQSTAAAPVSGPQRRSNAGLVGVPGPRAMCGSIAASRSASVSACAVVFLAPGFGELVVLLTVRAGCALLLTAFSFLTGAGSERSSVCCRPMLLAARSDAGVGADAASATVATVSMAAAPLGSACDAAGAATSAGFAATGITAGAAATTCSTAEARAVLNFIPTYTAAATRASTDKSNTRLKAERSRERAMRDCPPSIVAKMLGPKSACPLALECGFLPSGALNSWGRAPRGGFGFCGWFIGTGFERRHTGRHDARVRKQPAILETPSRAATPSWGAW